MKLLFTLTLSALVAAGALHRLAAQAPGDTRAFTGARVIDGTDRPPIDNATIVVRAGKIVSVAPASRAQVPANAERVPLDGKTVIPGIVNAHGHVGNT